MHMRGVPIVHARAALQHRAWPALIRLHAAEMDNWHCDSNTTYTMRNVARPSDLPARCGGPQDWLRDFRDPDQQWPPSTATIQCARPELSYTHGKQAGSCPAARMVNSCAIV